MSRRVSDVLLWLFVINLGTAFGAGIYEHRIAAAHWLISSGGSLHWNASAAQLDDTGRRFWAFVTTGPLTLLCLANLWSAWKLPHGRLRDWWLRASWLSLADRVVTFGYLIPTMVGLMSAPDSSSSVLTATRWLDFNYARHVLVLAAWLASLKALSLLASRATDS